ncbi:MAG: GNAT family N-acetyltransferase [bacterium]|jgi:ribosomal protein S18 acetylase RimI-like enzyme
MNDISAGFEVLPLTDERREWARTLIRERWGSVIVVTRGKVHNTSRLPGFVAVLGGDEVGLATYAAAEGECEIVSLDSLRGGLGIGTALVRAVERVARASGSKRLWLITTNDNVHAVRFYQKRGFRIAAIHLGALEESRRLKPEIPLKGMDGIPLIDEIELELML